MQVHVPDIRRCWKDSSKRSRNQQSSRVRLTHERNDPKRRCKDLIGCTLTSESQCYPHSTHPKGVHSTDKRNYHVVYCVRKGNYHVLYRVRKVPIKTKNSRRIARPRFGLRWPELWSFNPRRQNPRPRNSGLILASSAGSLLLGNVEKINPLSICSIPLPHLPSVSPLLILFSNPSLILICTRTCKQGPTHPYTHSHTHTAHQDSKTRNPCVWRLDKSRQVILNTAGLPM